mgnify:CR=1 FL=1|jgi:hypothetical protein
MEDLAVLVLLLVPPLGYVLAQRAALRWQGGWRTAGLVPLAGWALWATVVAIEVAHDPTAHNLLPFEILFGAALALTWIGALAVSRRLFARIA